MSGPRRFESLVLPHLSLEVLQPLVARLARREPSR